MENATSTKNISDLQSILNYLLKNAKINESRHLAESIVQGLRTYIRAINPMASQESSRLGLLSHESDLRASYD